MSNYGIFRSPKRTSGRSGKEFSLPTVEISTFGHQQTCAVQNHVRFGSKADICAATSDVRFTPDSDHESRHAAMAMSALHLKADMCGATAHVCFGPEEDIALGPTLIRS
jgi:hypothetical protein